MTGLNSIRNLIGSINCGPNGTFQSCFNSSCTSERRLPTTGTILCPREVYTEQLSPPNAIIMFVFIPNSKKHRWERLCLLIIIIIAFVVLGPMLKVQAFGRIPSYKTACLVMSAQEEDERLQLITIGVLANTTIYIISGNFFVFELPLESMWEVDNVLDVNYRPYEMRYRWPLLMTDTRFYEIRRKIYDSFTISDMYGDYILFTVERNIYPGLKAVTYDVRNNRVLEGIPYDGNEHQIMVPSIFNPRMMFSFLNTQMGLQIATYQFNGNGVADSNSLTMVDQWKKICYHNELETHIVIEPECSGNRPMDFIVSKGFIANNRFHLLGYTTVISFNLTVYTMPMSVEVLFETDYDEFFECRYFDANNSTPQCAKIGDGGSSANLTIPANQSQLLGLATANQSQIISQICSNWSNDQLDHHHHHHHHHNLNLTRNEQLRDLAQNNSHHLHHNADHNHNDTESDNEYYYYDVDAENEYDESSETQTKNPCRIQGILVVTMVIGLIVMLLLFLGMVAIYFQKAGQQQQGGAAGGGSQNQSNQDDSPPQKTPSGSAIKEGGASGAGGGADDNDSKENVNPGEAAPPPKSQKGKSPNSAKSSKKQAAAAVAASSIKSSIKNASTKLSASAASKTSKKALASAVASGKGSTISSSKKLASTSGKRSTIANASIKKSSIAAASGKRSSISGKASAKAASTSGRVNSSKAKSSKIPKSVTNNK